MKIVHVCLGCFYVEHMSYQENILPKFHKLQGHDVSIIASQHSFDHNYRNKQREIGLFINEDGIPVTIVGYSKFPFWGRFLRFYPDLYKELESKSPDIIFVHGPQFFGNTHLNKYKKHHPAVRIICDNHSDYINTPIKPLKYFILNKLLWPTAVRNVRNTADFFWGVTPLRVQYLQEIYKIPKKKTGLLIMGGDDSLINFNQKKQYRSTLCRELKINEDDFIIVTGGKINFAKRTAELVQAVLKLNNPKVHLIVFGEFPPEMNDVKKMSEESTNIHTVGWIDSSRVYYYFLASDLGCFPGTHSVLWEQAVASGLPCIFRKWEGMDHVLVDNNCVLIETYDVDDLKKHLMRFVNDPVYYSAFKEGAEHSKVNFLYSEIAKKAIDIPEVCLD